MKKLMLLITIFIITLPLHLSCQNQHKYSVPSKRQQLILIIKKTGFLELPLSFEALGKGLKNKYLVNHQSLDSLAFDKQVYRICGFLPDTTLYYSVVYNYPCSSIPCPFIMTIDKNGNEISNAIIMATPGCFDTPIEATSCYDSVWIDKDQRIRSISKVIGKVYVPDLKKEVDICNMRKLEGYIDKDGKIYKKESDVILCVN